MPSYSFSTVTSSLATPITPGSFRAAGVPNGFLFFMLVSGRKVALPYLFCFRKAIISFAVVSLSVTMFWMLPPSAVSMAVS